MMKVCLDIQTVAIKQLESSIWMYAYNYDEVAVHTIAGAAFELYTKRLGQSAFNEDVKKYLKPDKHKEFFSLWNKYYNYFKHGEHQNEPIETLDYDEEVVELLIYYAAEGNLAGPEKYRLSCALMFRYFFMVRHPDLLQAGAYEELIEKPFKKAKLSLEIAKDKETLRAWLDNMGHTFLNGTSSPYRDIAKK
jgi:hypothetical protein